MLCFSITYLNMSKPSKHAKASYTDKRTGITYTSMNHAVDDGKKQEVKIQPHLDAFISNAFLKTYFG